jgi:23S rRNA (uracil1939-C5)-methyltransferase
MTVGDSVELRIDRLAAGGDGLGFIDGIACFVALAAPGDRLIARIREARRDYCRAEIASVLEPAASRAEPSCPYYGACGGCSLMHLEYEAQLAAKRRIVADAFRRTGALPGAEEPPITPSAPLGYRNRAQFHFSPGGELGYARRSSNDILPIRSCPILAEPLASWLADHAGTKAFTLLGKALRGSPRFVAFAPGGSDGHTYLQGRDGELRLQVAGKPFGFHVEGFFQSNLSLLPALIGEACRDLHGARAADLYCGVGLFGAFLKERFDSLVCVEQDARALGYACRNVGKGADYAALSMESWTTSAQARASFDYVLVDPPRAGLAPVVRAWLLSSRPACIGYVSCDPVSLARDSGELVRGGYRLERLALYDFYPQTAHVESYARFIRE